MKREKTVARQKQQGFTLIELVLVIALLGILAVTALPQFFNINLTNAQNNSRDAVVGAVQAGLALYAANQIAGGSSESYPTNLDTASNTAASVVNSIFGNVIQNGVTSNWTKKAATCYDYTAGGGTLGYTYDNAQGTFIARVVGGVHVACP